jgi:hypothetical protein
VNDLQKFDFLTEETLKTNNDLFGTLLSSSREELLACFSSLKAPTLEEMNGEFDCVLPTYSNEQWRHSMAAMGKDYWLGKAYRLESIDVHVGHGYNRYRAADGRVNRLSRFVWDIAPSIVDQQPSLVMQYSAYANWGGSHDLIDEVRVLGSGAYLGIYHTAAPVPGFTPREGAFGRSALEVFLMHGPVGDFQPTENL